MTLQMASPRHLELEDWELPQCEGQWTKAEGAAEAGVGG